MCCTPRRTTNTVAYFTLMVGAVDVVDVSGVYQCIIAMVNVI